MKRSSWLALVLALMSSRGEDAASSARNTAASAPKPGRTTRHHLRDHLDAATDLQLAVTTGRLSDARDLAGWFAAHPMNEPDRWRHHLDELEIAARTIEQANDLSTVGAEIGRFGRACSSCHEDQAASVAFRSVPLPAGNTLEANMRRHQWAAARLWEGLIGPSERRWIEGARVMATIELDVRQTVHAKPNAEVVGFAEQLGDLGRRASELRDHDARAVLYGQMMVTCVGCHNIVRPHAVVARSR